MLDFAPQTDATVSPVTDTETDYLVVVGYRRSCLQGRGEHFAKAIRHRASDPVTAGERVLDDLISGPRYAYTSIHARVLDRRTGVALREIHVADGKTFGVRRAATRNRWQVPTEPATVDVRGDE